MVKFLKDLKNAMMKELEDEGKAFIKTPSTIQNMNIRVLLKNIKSLSYLIDEMDDEDDEQAEFKKYKKMKKDHKQDFDYDNYKEIGEKYKQISKIDKMVNEPEETKKGLWS